MLVGKKNENKGYRKYSKKKLKIKKNQRKENKMKRKKNLSTSDLKWILTCKTSQSVCKVNIFRVISSIALGSRKT